MSDAPKPAAKPPPPPPPAYTQSPFPAGTKPPMTPPTGSAPATPSPARPTTPVPVIGYAMPTHRSYLPSPALIKNLGCLFKLLFGLAVLLGLGYFALMAMNPRARQWATQGPKDGSAGPTPFKIINQILAIPAQALGKTDDIVKANNARGGQRNGLVAEEEGKAKGGQPGRTFAPVTDPFTAPSAADKKSGSATGAPAESAENQAISRAALLALAEKNAAAPPSAPPLPPTSRLTPQASTPDTPDQMKLAGDIIIAHASPAGSPRASAAFFYWVVKLNVSGVTLGKPARLFINNRLAYEGDEVNRTLGIVFARLDPANKLLVFRDAAGATVTRSY